MTPFLATLFLPFEQGSVPASGPAIFAGAAWHPDLKSFAVLDCWQPFKPEVDRLSAFGIDATPDWPEDKTYSLALVNIPKQTDEARYWLARSYSRLDRDGWLVAAAANDANGNRLEKWFAEMGLEPHSSSKNKARVVWGRRSSEATEVIDAWLKKGERVDLHLEDGLNFTTQPGVFGWDKIDAGSKILADNIPLLKGEGADFGCGNGYLLFRLLGKSGHTVSALHVVDADKRALECTSLNLEKVRANCAITTHWADLSKPVPAVPKLDFIVMNPPFHTGKRTVRGLGHAFIVTAASHLKKNGTLYMVANAHLPYEAVLTGLFGSVRQMVQRNGFKIIEAAKPS